MTIAIETRGLGKTYYRRKRGKGFWGGLRSYFSAKQDALSAVADLDLVIFRTTS